MIKYNRGHCHMNKTMIKKSLHDNDHKFAVITHNTKSE